MPVRLVPFGGLGVGVALFDGLLTWGRASSRRKGDGCEVVREERWIPACAGMTLWKRWGPWVAEADAWVAEAGCLVVEGALWGRLGRWGRGGTVRR
jgi:hypothetical protein